MGGSLKPQTGKTTSARWMVEHFNAGDRFCALWVDVQDAREVPDPAEAFELVLDDLDLAVEHDLPGVALPTGQARALEPARSCIRRYLQDLAAARPGHISCSWHSSSAW